MARVGDEAALYRPRAAVYRPPVAGRPAPVVGAGNPAAPPNQGGPPAPPQGGSIPGAGTYLQQQALAQRAYDQAQADIQYRRGQMYQEFGLLPGGQVDPHSQYGRYQQMLGQDAGAIHQAQQASLARGLGSRVGLGARVLGALRNAQGAEHFGFQQTLANNLHGFDQELLQAGNVRDAAMLSAEQAQAQWALDHNLFTPAAPGAAPTGSGGPAAPARTAIPSKRNVLAARRQLATHLRTVHRSARPGRRP